MIKTHYPLFGLLALVILTGCGTYKVAVKYRPPENPMGDTGHGKPVRLVVVDERPDEKLLGVSRDIYKQRFESATSVKSLVQTAFKQALSDANFVVSDQSEVTYQVTAIDMEIIWAQEFGATMVSRAAAEVKILHGSETVGTKLFSEELNTKPSLSADVAAVGSQLMSMALSRMAQRAVQDRGLASLAIGQRISTAVQDRRTAGLLHQAAKAGDVSQLRVLLEADADVNAQDEQAFSALHHAKNREVVELLIAKGADPNVRGPRGLTPLHTAASEGRTEAGKTLIERGADPERQALDESTSLLPARTPFLLAAARGQADFVQMLLASCPKLATNGVALSDGLMLAVNAAVSKRLQVVDFQSRWEELSQEQKAACVRLVKSLTGAGADANAMRFKGRAAPKTEKVAPGVEKQSTLVEGKIVDASNGGSTALHVAAFEGYPELVSPLIAAGAQISARDDEGRSVLDRAREKGDAAIVQLLENANPSGNSQSAR